MTTQICKHCDKEKPPISFKKYSGGSHKRAVVCIECKKSKPPKSKDALILKEYKTEHYKKNKLRYKDIDLVKRYGITYIQYITMRSLQLSKCYICQRIQPTTWHMCLDHNHQTGKIRKFLCRKCNMAVSIVEEVDYHKKIIKYLEEHK